MILAILLGAKLNGFETRYRVNQILIKNSLYRWYQLNQSIKNTVKTNANAVKCPDIYKGIALFGQSNSANRIKRTDELVKINDGKTFMYDWTSEKCYPYSEPLVGTDGEGLGNIISSTVKSFRDGGNNQNLIVIAFGRGGSSVFSWSDGVESIRLDEIIKRLEKNKINIDLALWHQGESDAIPEIYFPEKLKAYGMEIGQVRYFYTTALSRVLEKIHNSFPNAKIGLAIASICKNEGSSEVREAQKNLINQSDYMLLSSNTDNYGMDYRRDGCHFNERGEKEISKDYLNVFKAILN